MQLASGLVFDSVSIRNRKIQLGVILGRFRVARSPQRTAVDVNYGTWEQFGGPLEAEVYCGHTELVSISCPRD